VAAVEEEEAPVPVEEQRLRTGRDQRRWSRSETGEAGRRGSAGGRRKNNVPG